MKALIALVMKGRTQAILAVFLTAVLALNLSPLALVSAGVVVLATLRNGAQEGLLVIVAATVAIAVAGALLFGKPLVLMMMGLSLWLPVWVLSGVYGRSHSLARTLEVAAFGGIALIVLQYALLGDPAVYWRGMLDAYVDQTLLQVDAAQRDQVAELVSGWMTGTVAVSWMLGSVLALVVGRSAQGVLESRPLLGNDFRSLRFGRTWLILMPLLLVMALVMYDGQPSVPGQLFLVGMTLFLLQGIGLTHALVKANGGQTIWLFGLYLMLFFGGPYGVGAVAAAGYADGWANFRGRLKSGSDDSSSSD